MNTIRLSFKYNRKKKLNRQGEALVQIAAYQPRSQSKTKEKFFSTGVYLKPDQWDEKNNVIINHPIEGRLNIRIHKMMQDYKQKQVDIFNRFGKCTLADLQRDNDSSYMSFYEFFDNELKYWSKSKRKSTLRTYQDCLNKLKEYRSVLHFSDIGFRLIDGFDRYMKSIGLKDTTIAKYHSRLKCVIRSAIRKDYSLPKGDPYANFKVRRGNPEPRDFLTQEEISRLEHLEFEPDCLYLERERDKFLFSIYTGIRDETNRSLLFSMFQKSDEGYIFNAKSNKTGKNILLPLSHLFPNTDGLSKPEMILKKYEKLNRELYGYSYQKYPIFSKVTNQQSNRHLKTIAKLADIKKRLTTHVGRTTFACTMLNKNLPPHVLQELLQHSSIKTTMVYVNLTNQSIKQNLDQLKW